MSFLSNSVGKNSRHELWSHWTSLMVHIHYQNHGCWLLFKKKQSNKLSSSVLISLDGGWPGKDNTPTFQLEDPYSNSSSSESLAWCFQGTWLLHKSAFGKKPELWFPFSMRHELDSFNQTVKLHSSLDSILILCNQASEQLNLLEFRSFVKDMTEPITLVFKLSSA